MEEKERYRPIFENCIEDNITQITYFVNNRISICYILNQQSNRIKELEEKNTELEIKLDKYATELVNAESLVSYLENENNCLRSSNKGW